LVAALRAAVSPAKGPAKAGPFFCSLVIYWYFAEVSKLNANIGVSAAENRAAGAREHA
jgi:hypothetical protein